MSELKFLPIDLPLMIDKEEIYNGFEPDSEFHAWEFEKLTDTTDGKYGRNYIKDESRERFPTLCEYIDLLPYDAISNVKINCQRKPTVPHVDFTQPEKGQELWKNSVANEPCGYRIVIKGATDVLKIHTNDEIQTAYMPEETHAYAIDQSSGLHSVIDDPGRITVYTTGFINKDKHDKLIEKSLDKYRRYAIYKETGPIR